MKESHQIRFILSCYRAFGFYPLDIQSDSSNSLHLKINTSWYIYATIVTLISFINVVEVTVQPNWDISSFHGLISYTRLIMVSLDALICYMETLRNIRLHVEFFEIIAQLDAVFRKFKIRVSFKRLWLWVISLTCFYPNFEPIILHLDINNENSMLKLCSFKNFN